MNIQRPTPKFTMPADAKLVFKGKLYDVYQWEQLMFDGSFATFERLKRLDTACVIAVTEDGKIVVISEEQPGWPSSFSLIGGRIESDEDVLEGAKRELLEETGYTSDKWELFNATQPNGLIDWVIFRFIARSVKKIAEQKLDPGERIQIQEVDFDGFIELVLDDSFRDAELKMLVLKAKVDPEKMRELRNILVG